MYLFQRRWCSLCSYMAYIYIPLCIYFNGAPCPKAFLFPIYLHSTMYLFQPPWSFSCAPLPDLYLHSTMYLFQPIKVTHSRIFKKIYIPLCIYFNNFLHEFVLYGFFIYIPLCIYFNRRLFVKDGTSALIYIPLCIYFNLLFMLSAIVMLYLHSTMYLFQLLTLLNFSVFLIYLHSTMYLFQLAISILLVSLL